VGIWLTGVETGLQTLIKRCRGGSLGKLHKTVDGKKVRNAEIANVPFMASADGKHCQAQDAKFSQLNERIATRQCARQCRKNGISVVSASLLPFLNHLCLGAKPQAVLTRDKAKQQRHG